MTVLALDAIKFHRFGLAGREPLLLMLAASLLTFAATRLYTRVARVRRWRSGRVGDVHLHHMVAGNVLTLTCGMLELAFQPGDFGVDLLSIGFGVGAAFVLDEFALTVHLRDVYWTPEGRHSIEVSIIWALLGLMLLTGISPFGIHDQTETPRIIGFAVVIVSIGLSIITCLKGKLTLGLLSIFLPPVGLVAAYRLARPGSIWAQLFYNPQQLARARARFDPATSHLEVLRNRFTDLLGGRHDISTPEEPTIPRPPL
jgi:lysyl-tRNA synthetase class 2